MEMMIQPEVMKNKNFQGFQLSRGRPITVK
jgi:hypothetical protein